ncbi:hypothetical protein Cantr_08145 [Candida viswanathii]|uniref:Uncharacterized protein n=1 Tax=Candida viswanathii TaxID=5486 RepID=A0A367Y4H7_9ASCO|nr:hypothetical protein Cantr_08145 [Candida viswanathii]
MANPPNPTLRLVETLIPTTQIIVPYSVGDKAPPRPDVPLRHLKYITFTLPVLSRYKYSSYDHHGMFTEEMIKSYRVMEDTAVDLVTKIALITRHTWKYGDNSSHYAHQFMFLFNSLFMNLPLTGSQSVEDETRDFLLETFDDLYFHKKIQAIVHDVFLGLDNIYLKYYIADFLEVKYGYKIPVNFFVVGVCSLGLQLYRTKIEQMRKVVPAEPVEVISAQSKSPVFHWLRIKF